VADRKITDLTALTTPASGDVLPIVDVSEAAAADKNKKISIGELFKGIPDGTEAAPSLAFESDDGNGLYLAGTDTIGISTGGTQRLNINASGLVTINGDLTVSGTTTTIESQTLQVEDKNIEMGVVDTPSDVTADGGGITLKGTTDKTINWIDSTDSWTFSEHVDLASGKAYYINNTEVLNATTLGSGVTGSSLTSVGTLTGLTVSGTSNLAGVSVSGDISMTGTGAIDVASGTAAERPGTPSAGMIRFNTDDTTFEGYNGSAWGAIGGGATGGGSDKWAIEHDNTVNSSYTITANRNVISAGPITIASGATVTVGSSSNWAIV
jgi:hypothetical protein